VLRLLPRSTLSVAPAGEPALAGGCPHPGFALPQQGGYRSAGL